MSPEGSVSLDSAALIVVDMQTDFITGSLPVPGASAIIERVNLWIEIFEDLERPIVYSMDWHAAKGPHQERFPVHCVRGTDGAMIHGGVIYDPLGMPKVFTVLKGLGEDDGFSVCSQPSDIFTMAVSGDRATYPSVDALLKAQAVDTAVVVGVATDYCVRATVLDLLRLGYTVVLQLDAIAGVDLLASQAAVWEMQAAGAVLMADEKPVPCTVDAVA